MKITPICPACGSVAFRVARDVVCHFSDGVIADSPRWAACTSHSCMIAYFCGQQQITKAQLKQPLWYKDKRNTVPICYCSQLTRGEIHAAVRRGATAIRDVQRMTKKNRTGFCATENPLGECCRNAFLCEIARAMKRR